jgi:hypothetical protein
VPQVIEAQVDWLTVTGRDSADNSALGTLGTTLVHEEATNGNRVTEWRWMGYLGWHAGRASVGTGPQGSVLRLSGDLADQAFGEATAACDHVSRLDIAATVRLDGQDWRYEARRWAEYQAWLKEHEGDYAGRYMEDTRGGATAYIGSRTSEVLMRIYNKEGECKKSGDRAELERYQNCHRYELELKNGRACSTAATLSSVENREAAILGWLSGFLSTRGVATLDLTPEKIDLVPGFRRRSDTDSKLGWLASQVAPTMRWLVDHGQTEHVIKALGLDQMADTPSSQKMGAGVHQ